MNPEPTELHVLAQDGTCPHGCDYHADGDRHYPHRYPESSPQLSPDQVQLDRLSGFIFEHVPGEPLKAYGTGDQAIEIIERQLLTIHELITAIVHTVEYVGLDTLPAKPGWSWYDALRRYDPEALASLVDRTKPVPAEPGTAVGPHEFDRLSWFRPRTCRACWYHRDDHPITAWVPARPLGDTGPPDPPTLDRQSTSPRPIRRRPGRHRAPTIAP